MFFILLHTNRGCVAPIVRCGAGRIQCKAKTQRPPHRKLLWKNLQRRSGKTILWSVIPSGKQGWYGNRRGKWRVGKKHLGQILSQFFERNPQLQVYSTHLHIDFIPFTTGSKRGLSTRVSLKQALADQGITGEGWSLTARDLWVQKEKEALAAIMLEHDIE